LLTGDPTNADPVCDLSPHHYLVTDAVARVRTTDVEAKPIVFRDDRNSSVFVEAGATVATTGSSAA
jgi:pyrroloquinoline quinone biosynthesis protein E